MTACASPRSAAELAELLRSRPGRVRIVGGGSHQDRLVAAEGAVRVHVGGLATIARLDAPDQTCSVDCGVPRAELDAALAAVGLELPCPGTGTIGGLFAGDAIGPATHGGPSPRSLLLGMHAVLADGTPFKSGARVVKSVAGFDVHKLFVGSGGRLFVGTRLHLRLKPRPREQQWFAMCGLEAPAALLLLAALRSLAVPPAALQVARDAAGGHTVSGRIAGRASYVAATMRQHGLSTCGPCWRDHVELPPAGEVLSGLSLPSALPALLANVPRDATCLWHGGGRFEVALPTPAATDGLLQAMRIANLHGCIVRGNPERRGVGTELDPGAQRVADGLHNALDPDGILV